MKWYLVIASLTALSASAHAVFVTTGNLGPKIVTAFPDNGFGSVQLSTPGAFNGGPATLYVKQGVWNGTNTTVQVSLNGTPIGQFTTQGGYISPGAVVSSFANAGPLLLANSPNVISFQDIATTLQTDYAIGEVSFDYSAVPEPFTVLTLGAGIAVFDRKRRSA